MARRYVSRAGYTRDEPVPQWPHADPQRRTEAAAMLAAMGARRCMKLLPSSEEMTICRTPLANDGARRRYCSLHEPRDSRARKVARADRDAVTELLQAGAALRVP